MLPAPEVSLVLPQNSWNACNGERIIPCGDYPILNRTRAIDIPTFVASA